MNYAHEGRPVIQKGYDQPQLEYSPGMYCAIGHGTILDCGSVVQEKEGGWVIRKMKCTCISCRRGYGETCKKILDKKESNIAYDNVNEEYQQICYTPA